MLRDFKCPDCGTVMGEGSTSCVRCGCPMSQIMAGIKTRVKLPYTRWAGHNDVKSAPRDKYGNPNGTDYDLLRDGSMRGYRILLINLCPSWDPCGKRESYNNLIAALGQKGFEVTYTDKFPENFVQESADTCQVWIISGNTLSLTSQNIREIEDYYHRGKGLYLWADNDPFYADVNPIIRDLFGTELKGNYLGDKVIGVQKKSGDVGILPGHLISTGIANFYEGITISNIVPMQHLNPLIYSSDKKVVTAYSDADGKRILIDGGFTRLYVNWDSAGTDRYVVNAAGWLGNFERFGWRIP